MLNVVGAARAAVIVEFETRAGISSGYGSESCNSCSKSNLRTLGRLQPGTTGSDALLMRLWMSLSDRPTSSHSAIWRGDKIAGSEASRGFALALRTRNLFFGAGATPS